ncbi:probable indole-3-acetic acid-amido synthetase GH3.6 [Oryza brachyantha]|uniref:probable indole-3-acetic acid-amido synthetase GH3.6 n=1 Tax=Oryza brachyantha TaxID=4533 RepID=UPI001ADCA9ED|nr:probable indole-3-acetic acid-amido synthetase GH3.6 [Oryza brachyantha]
MATAAADELALRRLDDATRDAPRLQLETLRAILAESAGAAYLRRYVPDDAHHRRLLSIGLAAAADEFRRVVPVSSYEDYAESIRRVADGEARPDELELELSPRRLLCFFLSSGTSSLRPKLIPYLDSPGARAASAAVMQANSALVRRMFPPRPSVSKALWFLYAGEVTKTKGGHEAMATTAWGIRSSGLRATSPVMSACVSPVEVILGADYQQQMYCHLLCGLRRWDAVDCIRAPYAAGLARALRLLQSKWRQLCADLESGTVCAEVVTDAAMRGAVQDGVLAGPRPELADRVRRVCEREDWRGVLRDLWPEARYVSCVTTGIMEQYFPAIKHFAGEAVPVLGTDYLASECPIGINLERTLPPEETTYVLLPTAAYFEFIPFDMDAGRRSDTAEPVDITGVEAGKTYEVVASTFRGLYRYRIGDVVKVTGFHNSSPRLQFVTRAPPPQEHAEMLNERDVMAAMDTFQLMLKEHEEPSLPAGGEVVEFAAFISDDGGRRLRGATIAVEVRNGSRLPDHERSGDAAAFLRRCCAPLEGCFGGAYRLSRATGDVAPLEIAVVTPGTFDRLAEEAISGGAPANQYKPPKIVRHRRLIDVLQSSIVCSSCTTDSLKG